MCIYVHKCVDANGGMRTGATSTKIRAGAGCPHSKALSQHPRGHKRNTRRGRLVSPCTHTGDVPDLGGSRICGKRVVRGSLARRVADSSALCCHLGNKPFWKESSTSTARKEKPTAREPAKFPPEFVSSSFWVGAQVSPTEPGVSCYAGLGAHPPDGTAAVCWNRKAN